MAQRLMRFQRKVMGDGILYTLSSNFYSTSEVSRGLTMHFCSLVYKTYLKNTYYNSQFPSF